MAVSAVTGVTSTYTPSTVRTSSTTPSSCTTTSSSATATSSTTAISRTSTSSSTVATSSTTACTSTTSTTVNHSSATARATSSTTVSYSGGASSTAKVSSTTVTSSTTASMITSSSTTVASSTTLVSSSTASNSIKVVPLTVEDIIKLGLDAELKETELRIEQSEELYNWLEENVLQPIKKFLDDIEEDIENYDRYNTDIDKIHKSNYFSSYKGVPVIRIEGERSGSFGVIFITYENGDRQEADEIVKHEYGHTKQFEQLGLVKYALCIALPSWQKWGSDSYYAKPWEATANDYGGAEFKDCTQEDIEKGFEYLEYSKYFGPLAWMLIE